MRKLVIALFLLAPALLQAQQGDKNFIDQNYIEVTGKAEMEIAPDEIYLRILINEKDFKGKGINDIEKSMFDKLTELGIDLSKELVIKDLLSNFQYYWLQKADVVLTKEYQLIVHDGKTAGKVFLELQSLGISNISVIKVENSEITKFRREVKVAAIKAAQEKARDLANAINQEIGRAIYIQEIENNYKQYSNSANSNVVIRGYAGYVNSMSPESNIEFEKIQLEYSIIARFELK